MHCFQRAYTTRKHCPQSVKKLNAIYLNKKGLTYQMLLQVTTIGYQLEDHGGSRTLNEDYYEWLII